MFVAICDSNKRKLIQRGFAENGRKQEKREGRSQDTPEQVAGRETEEKVPQLGKRWRVNWSS
jgi:hypothetical protein